MKVKIDVEHIKKAFDFYENMMKHLLRESIEKEKEIKVLENIIIEMKGDKKCGLQEEK